MPHPSAASVILPSAKSVNIYQLLNSVDNTIRQRAHGVAATFVLLKG